MLARLPEPLSHGISARGSRQTRDISTDSYILQRILSCGATGSGGGWWVSNGSWRSLHKVQAFQTLRLLGLKNRLE